MPCAEVMRKCANCQHLNKKGWHGWRENLCLIGAKKDKHGFDILLIPNIDSCPRFEPDKRKLLSLKSKVRKK